MNEMLYHKVHGFLRNAVNEALHVDDSEMVDRLSRALICLEVPAAVNVFADEFFERWEAEHPQDRHEEPKDGLWSLPGLRRHIVEAYGVDPAEPVPVSKIVQLSEAYGKAFTDAIAAWAILSEFGGDM